MLLDPPALAYLIPEFRPETTLEVRLSTDPSIFAGLAWGAPRPGHPEGTVAAHVAAMLRRIPTEDPDRAALRALAILHDAAKMAVRRDDAWSPDNDHAVLARRLAEAYTDDARLLAAIELHDEPYWRWRHDGSGASVDSVLERVIDPALFVRFVELDASTEGKDLSFLWWFRRKTIDVPQVAERDWSRAPLGGADDACFLYAKAFAVEPASQPAVSRALRTVTADGASLLAAEGRVLVSEDGLRALLLWRFRGDPVGRVLREGTVVRRVLRRHAVLRHARAVEARLYRLDGEGSDEWPGERPGGARDC
jgi:hypothetical protein